MVFTVFQERACLPCRFRYYRE